MTTNTRKLFRDYLLIALAAVAALVFILGGKWQYAAWPITAIIQQLHINDLRKDLGHDYQ